MTDSRDTEGKQLVNRMTNHQRNKWARAGYPGLRGSHYQPEKIRPFVPDEDEAEELQRKYGKDL